MTDVFLYAGESPNDVKLRDPTRIAGKQDYVLVCETGTYTYAGSDAQIPVARNLAGETGTYTYSGSDAQIPVARQLAGNTGTYTYSGVAALIPVARNLAGETGTYSYSGLDAQIPVSRNLAGDTGTYSYAGNDATLAYVPGVAVPVNYTLDCETGSYVLSGQDAILTVTSASESKGGWSSLQRKVRKSDGQIEQERIALGILPEPVAKIANKIAQKAIRAATIRNEPDVLDWALQDEQQALYERQMRLEMSRSKLIWDAAYQRLFEIALQEALLAEEVAIVMLMMEL